MFPFGLDQALLSFRFEPLPDGGLRAWIDAVPASDPKPPEVESVTLSQAEANELGMLLASIAELLVRARKHAEAPSPPERPPEERPHRKPAPSTTPQRMRPPKPKPN